MPLEFIRDYLTELDATIRALPHEQIAGIIDAVDRCGAVICDGRTQ